MTLRGRSALLLALVVAASWLVVPWAARAQTSTTTTQAPPALDDCENLPKQADLSIRYCTLPDRTSTTATFPLKVEVRNSGGTALRDYLVTAVSLEIVPTLADQEVPEPATTTWDGASRTVVVEWAPTFTTNGRYDLRIAARGDGPGGQQNSATVSMFLAAPPHPPKGVKLGEADDRSVVVTWERNAEPDVLRYHVRRAAAGSTSSVAVGTVEVGDVLRVVDTPGEGTWRYRVTAVRRGATPAEEDQLASPATTGTIEVEPAASSGGGDGTTTTTAATGSTTGTAGTAGTAATTTSSRATITTGPRNNVDLSRAAPATGGRRTATTVRRVEPDTGFDETLPFDLERARPEALPEEEPVEVGAPAPQALGQELISDDGERRRSLGFVAFGLLLFVLGMTGFFLKAEVRRVDELDSLDPEVPVPVPPTLLAASAEPPVAEPAELLEPVDAAMVPVSDPLPVPEPAEPAAAALVPAATPAVAAAGRRRRSRARVPRREPIDVDLAGAADDDGHLAELAEALQPATHPRPPGGRVRRTVAPIDAPDLDVPDPATPARRPPTTTRTRTTDRARRAPTRLPSRPADDRREGGAAVRTRRRGTGQGDRRLPVG